MSTQEAGSPGKQRRGRVYALLAIASLLAFLSVFAIWANRQALENDTWTETSTELLEDPDIREAVADFMVDELFANVDVQAELAQTLPPRLQPLAGPAAGALRGLADRLANEALQRPRVQKLWEEANRNAHQTFIDVVEHDADEDVNLDLGAIVGDLGEQLGVDVSSRLPPGSAQIEVISQDQLSGVQKAVKALRGAAIALLVLSLVLYRARDLPGARVAPRGAPLNRLRLHPDRGRGAGDAKPGRGRACRLAQPRPRRSSPRSARPGRSAPRSSPPRAGRRSSTGWSS